MEDDGAGGWIVTQDMYNATQNISASINDLYADSSGGIYACGSDVGGHPNIYYKASGAAAWTVLSSGGAGIPDNVSAKAITVDEINDDVYIALDHEIYVLYNGDTSWTLYHEYPVGTDILFIYYDELLVGTGTGLYAHEQEVSVDPDIDNGAIPDGFDLLKAYPNPFNASTLIEYLLPYSQRIDLSVYNIYGQKLTSLYSGYKRSGQHTIQWDAKNYASGTYLLKLSGSGISATEKILLLK